MAKRVFDVLFAAAGLVLLAPALAVLAVCIVFESGAPVFFRQIRVGRGGRLFRILKFRTMVRDAETLGPKITSRGDTRITRLGQWLRRHKLDELPQLWNVLVGDMSLVGPRPEVPEYVDAYPSDVRALILTARPGITDPASVVFFDEAGLLADYVDPDRAYRELILPKKLAIYSEYVRTRTLLKDLRTIFATLGRALTG